MNTMTTTPTATPRTDAAWSFAFTASEFSAASAARQMRDKCAELETELAAAKAECNRLYESSPTALDALTAELARLRAENLTAHQMACAAGLERDQLRAEVSEARRAWLGDDYGHLPLIEALEKFRSDSDAQSDRADVLYQRSCEVEHALRAEVERLDAEKPWLKEANARAAHAEAELAFQVARNSDLFTQRDEAVEAQEKAEAALAARDAEYMRGGKMLAESAAGWQARAERAEAALAEWSVLNLWGGTPEIIHEFIKGQQNRIHHCQNLEAECLEQARLLGKSGEREADLLGKIDRLNRVIERASVQFFHEGTDGETAAKMLNVLNEAK